MQAQWGIWICKPPRTHLRNLENSYWPTTFAAQWVEQILDLERVKDINGMKMQLETLQLCAS